jgi:hypothetical protein
MVLNKDKDRSSQQSTESIDSGTGGLTLAYRAVPGPESGGSARDIKRPPVSSRHSGLTPSDISRRVTSPTGHRSPRRKIDRDVSEIADKPIIGGVVNHDAGRIQGRIGLKKIGGSLRVNQFCIQVLIDVTLDDIRRVNCKIFRLTLESLRILLPIPLGTLLSQLNFVWGWIVRVKSVISILYSFGIGASEERQA